MDFNFLSAVDLNLINQLENLPKHTFGNSIKIHTTINGIPNLDNVQVAIISVGEDRDSLAQNKLTNFNELRYSLYRLFSGNWNVSVADMGHIEQGDSPDETVENVCIFSEWLLKKNITPIVLGGTQSITYGLYRAFDTLKKGVNLINIDSRFDFSLPSHIIDENTYISNIVRKRPLNLFNLTNIGYQTYYVAQEEIDLMEKMFFEGHRLGNISIDLSSTEYLFRNADIVGIDVVGSVKGIELGLTNWGLPNGFNSKDLCILARYSGISDSVKAFGLFECPDGYISNQLIAQAIWYFIEGFNYREWEYPSTDDKAYEKYTVTLDQQEISFYKSLKTERWWIAFSNEKTETLFPCNYSDYLEACENNLPQTWQKIYLRLSNF